MDFLLDSNVTLNIPDTWQALVAFIGAVLALCLTLYRIGLRLCKLAQREIRKTVSDGVAVAFTTHRGEHEAIVNVLTELGPEKTRAAGLTGRPWDGLKPERPKPPAD